MSQRDTQFPVVNPVIFELAQLLEPTWPAYSAELRRKPTLVCEGAGGEGGEGGEGGGEGAGGAAITFSSQEDFDRAIGKRLAKEREGITKKYGDLDDLQRKAKEFDDIQAAGQSELEKAQTRIEELEKGDSTTKSQLQEARLEAAVAAKAGEKKIVDVDLALAALSRSDIKVEFDDNGKPKDIGKVLDELLKEKPALAGKARSSGFDGGTRGGVQTGGASSMDEAIRARHRGR